MKKINTIPTETSTPPYYVLYSSVSHWKVTCEQTHVLDQIFQRNIPFKRGKKPNYYVIGYRFTIYIINQCLIILMQSVFSLILLHY